MDENTSDTATMESGARQSQETLDRLRRASAEGMSQAREHQTQEQAEVRRAANMTEM